MKKRFIIYSTLVALFSVLLATPVALADTWNYDIKIEVRNNSTVSYTNMPIRVSINTTQLASLGYINSTGLNTKVFLGSTPLPHMVSTDAVRVVLPTFTAGSKYTLRYRLGNNPGVANFPHVGDANDTSATYIYAANSTSLNFYGDDWAVEWRGNLSNLRGGALVEKGGSYGILFEPPNTLYVYAHNGTELAYRMYPNAQGTWSQFEGVYPSGISKWDAIDDVTPDDAATYIYTGVSRRDSYKLTSPPPPPLKILSVSGYYRVRHTSSSSGYLYPGISLNGTYVQSGSSYMLSSLYGWQEIVHAFPRPGGGSWSYNDLCSPSLELGLNVTPYTSSQIWCTAAHLRIGTYTSPVITNTTAGEHTVRLERDGTTLKLFVDNMSTPVASTTISGSLVVNSNPLIVGTPPAAPLSYLKIWKAGTLVLYWNPAITSYSDSLNPTDQSGYGNHGTTSWASNNPSFVEITVGELRPSGSHVAEQPAADNSPPEVIRPPGNLTLFEDPNAPASHLPVYDGFSQAAAALGVSVQTMYGIAMLFTGISMGVATMVATGSLTAGVIGMCLILAFAASTGVLPFWIPLVLGLAGIFIVVISRSM